VCLSEKSKVTYLTIPELISPSGYEVSNKPWKIQILHC
jgi:hypothetical protein